MRATHCARRHTVTCVCVCVCSIADIAQNLITAMSSAGIRPTAVSYTTLIQAFRPDEVFSVEITRYGV